MGAAFTLTLQPGEDHTRLAAGLAAFAREARLPERTRNTLTLVLEEVVTNVINHGAGPRGATIAVEIDRRDNHLAATVSDDAAPFDPLALPAPDTLAGIDERPIGGLGIHFVRTLTQNLDYRRDGHRNILSFTIELTKE